MYGPSIQSARTIGRYMVGPYKAVLFDQIVAEGPITYDFMIVVVEESTTTPILFVTSERSDPEVDGELLVDLGIGPDMIPTGQAECHFLCVFDAEGHHNLGPSNDWSEVDKFEAAALQILTECLGETPVVIGR